MDRLDWRAFEDRMEDLLAEKLDREFTETKLPVGPDLQHKFDLVSADNSIVVECKSYTWTDGENFPQAKISTANEALLFLDRVDAERKLLVMQDDISPDGRSLVNTYVRRYDGLMDDIEVWQYVRHDEGEETLNKIRDEDRLFLSDVDSPIEESGRESENRKSYSGKYAPLYDKLGNTRSGKVEFSFEELNDLLQDPLPNSAYEYRTWWSVSGHSHAQGWESIGWTVAEVDQSEEWVVFEEK